LPFIALLLYFDFFSFFSPFPLPALFFSFHLLLCIFCWFFCFEKMVIAGDKCPSLGKKYLRAGRVGKSNAINRISKRNAPIGQQYSSKPIAQPIGPHKCTSGNIRRIGR